jgi:hypothetical protein
LGISDRVSKIKEGGKLPQNFKLKIYASFRTRNDSIGLDLLMALENHCKRKKLDNFELYLRLS